MEYKIQQVDADEELKACVMRWFFIYPSCHQVFDAGFTVDG